MALAVKTANFLATYKEFLRSSHLFAMLFFDEIHPLLWILIRYSLSHIVAEIWDPKEHHPPFLFAGSDLFVEHDPAAGRTNPLKP